MNESAPIVMCVDDDPHVLESLMVCLRREPYHLHTATSAEEALAQLEKIGGASVVISDMRMPMTSGAQLLKQVKSLYPEATRMLFTGDPGRDAAATAVNEGQIFRFLTKPCPQQQLKAAIEAAVEQHRLVSAERVLLQQTLTGCLKALIDILAITSPIAFGRASRVKRIAKEFAEDLGYSGFWQLDAAAMLSQLGYIALPIELVEKLYHGERLTPEEQVLAAGVPQVATRLLSHVPRLDSVLQMLQAVKDPAGAAPGLAEEVRMGAQILGLVLDFDDLVTQGHSAPLALKMVQRRTDRYSPDLIAKFTEHVGVHAGKEELREISLRHVHLGMVFAQDLRTEIGTLLVPRGFEVTDSFLERMRNFGPGLLAEKVQMLAPPGGDARQALRAYQTVRSLASTA